VVLPLLVCLGCSPGPAGEPAGAQRILRLAYEREIDVLNPFTSQNLVDISFSMMEGLVTTNDRNEYVPVLAREIPTRENGLIKSLPDGGVEMTWHLHENVRWHDGAPFTSEDVCFTWRFVTSPNSETYNREQYLGIKACRTPDPHTVVFTWDGEYAYYPGLFEAVLPAHTLGGLSAGQIVNNEPFNRGPGAIGTGPFKFSEWRAGEFIRVVRNTDYWRGSPYPEIDEVVWSFIPDANTRLNAMRSGAYEWGRIQPTQVSLVRALPGYEVHLIHGNSVLFFDLCVRTAHGRAVFGDTRVRRALFLAVDRKAIADKLMEGTVQVANSTINPSSPFYDPTLSAGEHDPAASERLLDEAGWARGADGWRRKDGQLLSFTIMNRGGMLDRIQVAQVIQAELKQVGVAVSFETLESAAWSKRWRSGEWEAVVSAWFLPADPGITGLYACDGANNMTGFCDPGLDVLLKRSDHELEVARRKELLDQALRRLFAGCRAFPLYYNVTPELVSRRVQNYRGSGTNFGSFWNLYDWSLRG
jgi:peptide/nickel transport system substrate-binding protein